MIVTMKLLLCVCLLPLALAQDSWWGNASPTSDEEYDDPSSGQDTTMDNLMAQLRQRLGSERLRTLGEPKEDSTPHTRDLSEYMVPLNMVKGSHDLWHIERGHQDAIVNASAVMSNLFGGSTKSADLKLFRKSYNLDAGEERHVNRNLLCPVVKNIIDMSDVSYGFHFAPEFYVESYCMNSEPNIETHECLDRCKQNYFCHQIYQDKTVTVRKLWDGRTRFFKLKVPTGCELRRNNQLAAQY